MIAAPSLKSLSRTLAPVQLHASRSLQTTLHSLSPRDPTLHAPPLALTGHPLPRSPLPPAPPRLIPSPNLHPRASSPRCPLTLAAGLPAAVEDNRPLPSIHPPWEPLLVHGIKRAEGPPAHPRPPPRSPTRAASPAPSRGRPTARRPWTRPCVQDLCAPHLKAGSGSFMSSRKPCICR